jgi:hypothetical protein
MTVAHKTSVNESILSWFARQLTETAKLAGLSSHENEELASTIFRGGQNQESAQIQPTDLPTRVLAVKLGRHSVLLGELPPTPSKESIEDVLRRFRNQAVIARSYLTANEALDLQVFLVGPAGSEANDRWLTLGLLIERDEKVARKLAWLRPSEKSNDIKSYGEFIRRSFLAQPWVYDGVFTVADLDSLTRIPELADGSLPRNTAEQWVRLTTKYQDDTVTLVDSLIDAWGNRGKA